MRYLFFFLIFSLYSSSVSAGEEDTLKRLQNTAKAFHKMAERQMILAESEKDPEKKKELLESAAQSEASAELTDKKITEEEFFLKDNHVLAARRADQEARKRLKTAEANLDAVKNDIQTAAGVAKDKAEKASEFLTKMKEWQVRQSEAARANTLLKAAENHARKKYKKSAH